MLQECDISFEILQEFSSGSRGDRITLGNIKLNLAEYVDRSEDENGIVRRPPLKSAMVFGGIAGILPHEHGETEEPGSLPSINVSRELGDLQDMYRRTLAASWTAHGDELLPDQLIEDLFAGGRGVRSATRPGARSERADDDDSNISDTDSRTTVQESRTDNKRPK
ncbi:hypothetical protein F66182_11568, partial [Fusarium sp. NRRL 66182]